MSVTNAGPTDHSIDATLDFVNDLGADPHGDTPADDALAALNALQGSIRVIVPDGAYRLSDRAHRITAPTNGLRVFEAATGASPSLVAPSEYCGPWLSLETDGAVRGIDIDRTPNQCSPELRIDAPHRFAVADMTVYGRDRLPDDEQGNGVISIAGQRESTNITLDAVRITGAASDTDGTLGGPQPGVVIGPDNQGSVRLRDCTVVECSSRGVDAARSVGPVTVQGGTYRDNNRAQIRLCGPGMSVVGARVGVDLIGSSLPAGAYNPTSGITNEALTPRPGARPPSGGTIEDTGVWVRTGASGTLRGAYYGTPLAGGMTLRGCDLVVDVNDVPAIDVTAPERIVDAYPPESPLDIQLRNIACRGEARSGTAVRVEGRPGTAFRRSCVALPGSRQGYELPRQASVSEINTRGGCTGPPE